MQDFAEQNCAIFDGAKEEHSLEQTDIHQRFKALFERLVEEYIESLGVSIGEFYQMVVSKFYQMVNITWSNYVIRCQLTFD